MSLGPAGVWQMALSRILVLLSWDQHQTSISETEEQKAPVSSQLEWQGASHPALLSAPPLPLPSDVTSAERIRGILVTAPK